MSDYTVLRSVSETLRHLFDAHILSSGEAGLAGVPVDLRSPAQLQDDNVAVAVSLWMYRVTVQPDLLNAPPAPSVRARPRHPLPLEVCYLVTAIHPDARTQLQLTGRVIQVAHDHARLHGDDLRDDLAGSSTSLRLSLDATSLSEESTLWHALHAPFRLSVPLRVQAVSVDSHLPSMAASRVLAATMDADIVVGTRAS